MKAVSDVIAPLSGEILEVNEKAIEEPEIDQRRPVRRRLARPDPAHRSNARSNDLLDVEGYQAVVAEQ